MHEMAQLKHNPDPATFGFRVAQRQGAFLGVQLCAMI